MEKSKLYSIHWAIYIFLAIVAFIYAGVLLNNAQSIRNRGESVQGTVDRTRSRRFESYYIWVEYFVEGERYVQRFDLARFDRNVARGTHITVHYNPENPSEAVLGRMSGLEGNLLIFGVIFTSLGLASFFRRRATT